MALDLETSEAKANEIRHAFHDLVATLTNAGQRAAARRLRLRLYEAAEILREEHGVTTYAGVPEPPKP